MNGNPSRILAWRSPWTEEPVNSSSWDHKESDMTERLPHFTEADGNHEVFDFTPSPFSRKVKSLSRVRLFATLWTVAHQAPSMGFSRQEYWSGLPFTSPRYLLDPGIEPRSPALRADALTSEPPGKPFSRKGT